MEPVNIGVLAQKGVAVPHPADLVPLRRYHPRDRLTAMAEELFHMVGTGTVKANIGATYPLAEAARAHRDLEARRTTGSLVLIP